MTSKPKWFDEDEKEVTKEEVTEALDELVAEAQEMGAYEVEEKPLVEDKVEAVVEKPKYADSLIRSLRRLDHVSQKTCRSCAKRVPLSQIDNGKAEECDDCRE